MGASSEARAVWDSVAEAYARQAARAFAAGSAVAEWLAEAAGARAGTTILDIAAGPGQTTIAAAARGARVICSDNAPAMVEVARRWVADAGHTDVDFRVLDALDLDLGDDSVDGVTCRYGMMLMPDPARAFGEVRRALRPGRPFAYAVWGPEEANGWATLIRSAVAEAGFDVPPPPGPGGMFVLADPADNERLARAAGFATTKTVSMELPMVFGSFDEYWSLRLEASPSSRALLEPLGEAGIARVRERAEELAAPFIDGELRFPTTTMLVRAS